MKDEKPFAYACVYNPDPENLSFDVFPTLEKAIRSAWSNYNSPEHVSFTAYYHSGKNEDIPEEIYSEIEKNKVQWRTCLDLTELPERLRNG